MATQEAAALGRSKVGGWLRPYRSERRESVLLGELCVRVGDGANDVH